MKKRRSALLGLRATHGFIALLTALVVAGCSSSHTATTPAKQYSTVYKSNGHVYTRSYDSNTGLFIWYILFLNNGQLYNSSASSALTGSALSGTAWRQTTSAPATSTLQPTSDVVSTDPDGNPSNDAVESDSSVPSNDVTGDDTTSEEEQSNTDDGGSGDDGGDDSGGDDGGDDSGDDGGDDGGDGGDSGGGDGGD
jgi:hypothetical protein